MGQHGCSTAVELMHHNQEVAVLFLPDLEERGCTPFNVSYVSLAIVRLDCMNIFLSLRVIILTWVPTVVVRKVEFAVKLVKQLYIGRRARLSLQFACMLAGLI